MIFYRSIIGSSTYGLRTHSSDIDVGIITDEWFERTHIGRFHFICTDPNNFIASVLYQKSLVWTQWFFPKWAVKNELYFWIKQNREDVIYKNKKQVYVSYIRSANRLNRIAPFYYKTIPKQMAYSTLFYDTVARYAEGISFEEAIRPEQSMRQKLLAMRTFKMDEDEAVALNEEAKERAIKAAPFYQVERDDAFLEKCKHELMGFFKRRCDF